MAVSGSGSVQHVSVDITTATTTTIVTGVTGKVVRVISYSLQLAGTTPTFKFQSSTSVYALSGAFNVAGIYPMNGNRDAPLMETETGASLQIVSTGTTPTVKGHISYTIS